MSKGAAIRNTMVGLAFLGSLIVLGVVTLQVSDLSVVQGEAVLQEVRFPTIDLLSEGDHVVVHGFRVGQVKKISLRPKEDPDNPVHVLLSVRHPIDVDRNTKFSIHSAGALGGRYLEITPRSRELEISDPELNLELAPGELPVGEASGDLFRQLGRLVEENEERITEILSGIQTLIEDMREGRGMIGKALQDRELADDFGMSIRAFRQMAESFRKVGESINNSEGLVGSLINDAEARDRALNVINNVSDLTDSLKSEKGIIPLLLNNEEAKEDLRAAIVDLRQIAHKASEGDGVIAALLNDSELADNVTESVESFNEIVQKANSGHGTLGQIINNPKAWDELVQILVQARETIEDLREQAPISTFVNAVFAVF
ncbi:MAG: MlaD family protein [Planctomycetes bacterium]|nr:MlaD family protein [Planctomycetota bacterium]